MKKLFALLMAILFVLPVHALETPDALLQKAADGVARATNSKHPLDDISVFTPGTSTADWMAVAYAVGGLPVNGDRYAKRLSDYAAERYDKDGGFGDYHATEWQRIAIVAAALGRDPTAFSKTKDGKPIDFIADGAYNPISVDLSEQGLNALVFALIAVDTRNYEIPKDALWTRERLLDAILSYQNADGGFGLLRGSSDGDLTAMTVQALAKYQGDKRVQKAIERSLQYYQSSEMHTCETVAQWTIAACALGMDARTDKSLQKNNLDLVSCLLQFSLEDGTFCHASQDEETNLMATAQAMLALAAVQKYTVTGKGLYDFSDVPIHTEKIVSPVLYVGFAGGVLLMGAVLVAALRRKKKNV